MNFFCSPTDAAEKEQTDSALECDYDKDATTLYQAIESEAWIPVLEFLETGKWEHMFRSDPNPPSRQAQTWVTRFENGKVRWSLLPIHLALIKSAPPKIIISLLELHPLGAKSVDDQGSLPLHLAFKHGASDLILIDLIQRFPAALFTKDTRGRVPTDIDGAKKERTALLRAVVKATTSSIDSKQKASHVKKVNELSDDLVLQQNLNANLENEKSELERRLTLLKTECLKLKRENRSLLDQREAFQADRLRLQQSQSPAFVPNRPLLDPLEEQEVPGRSLNKICSRDSTIEEHDGIPRSLLGKCEDLQVLDNTGSRRPVPQRLTVQRIHSNDISTTPQIPSHSESRSDNESMQQIRGSHSEDVTSFAATLRKESTRRKKQQPSRTRPKYRPASESSKGRVYAKQSTWTGNVRMIPEPHPGTRARKTHGFFGDFSGHYE